MERRIRANILVILVFFILTAFQGFSQRPNQFREEADFMQYLFRNHQYSDAVFLLKTMDIHTLSNQYADTLNYLIGKAFYLDKQPDSAMTYFNRLNNSLKKATKPGLYKFSISGIALNFPKAKNYLNDIECNNMNQKEQVKFGELGLLLLQKDIVNFDRNLNNYQFVLFNKEVQHLESMARQLEKQYHKKPWVAGSLSAILPGAGKFYAGKKGEAFSDLLITGSLAVFTYESYRKKGIDNFKTILFGSLFTVFHIGNIWGSVFAVKRQKDELEHQVDEDIYLHFDSVFDLSGSKGLY